MVLKRLTELISELFDIDESDITEKTSFEEDLCADSLDIAEFIMMLEEEYDLENLEEEDLDDYPTVGDVVRYIKAHQPDAN